MIARTVEIDLDDAVAGMVLVNPILDAHGGVLLPAGAKLGESTLTSLRRRGVDRVAVLNNEISDAELAAEAELVQGRLAVLFRRSAGQGASDALQQSVLRYRLGSAE